MVPEPVHLIDQAADLLKSARSVFVLTGAGISAESGVPTFRGSDGLWNNYSAEQLATPEAFARDPGLVWSWYRWRQGLILKSEPNAAHYAIVEIEKLVRRFLLLTQNVDDLHSRAGSQNVLELHGNIFRTRCSRCGRKEKRRLQQAIPDGLPKCECGGLLRPDVVWFGEQIPSRVWADSIDFLNRADLAIVCGTSVMVWPAAALPSIACERGIRTLEINLEPTAISSIVDVSIAGRAGEVLPQVLARFSS